MTALRVDIPVIETPRLILRAGRETDLDAQAAFYATDRAQYVGGPLDRVQTWLAIAAGLGHWVIRGYGMWTLQDRATGLPCGRCGFIFREGWDEPELAWQVFAGHEGHGIAHEAVLAARDHGARHFGLDRTVSYIDPANTRSQRLADRLGAVHEGDTMLLGGPVQAWRHPQVAP